MEVTQNSFKAWLLASRPKTLSGAAVPVMIGSAYAWHLTGSLQFNIVAMVLCFLFAFIMQIDANFVNDYYDCLKGMDNEDRLGPQRACQQGWISMHAMRIGIAITTIFAAAVGLPMIFFGGWQLIFIGALCILFCFLYTTCLAGHGLGDVLVLLFFGIVPVVFTAYVIVGNTSALHSLPLWTLGLACGMVVDTLLIVNNYRDIDNDRKVGKITLVVAMGRHYAEKLYLTLVPLALIMSLWAIGLTAMTLILCLPVVALHLHTWHEMRRIHEGRELNRILGMTARNIFVYGIMTSFMVFFV